MGIDETPGQIQKDAGGAGPGRDPNSQVVFDLLRLALKEEPLEMRLGQLLARLGEILGSDAGFILILNKKQDAYLLLAHRGLPEPARAALAQVPMDDPLLACAAGRTEPLIIDLSEAPAPFDALGGWLDTLAVAGLAGLAAPFGFLGTARAAEPDRPALDLDLLGLLASQVAMMVENARLRRSAEELMVLNERNRLARDLHDSVTQSLYSLTLFAEAGERMLAAGQPEQAALYLSRVNETGQQALREMRLLVHKLRPSILGEEGLRAALHQRLRAVEGRTGIDYRLVMGENLALPAGSEEVSYYIIQEALNNAVKHARASQVEVRVESVDGSDLQLVVVDNGIGFDPDMLQETAGFGVTSMRERAEQWGGSLAVSSQPGHGTRIEAHLRLDRPPADQKLADLL